MPTNCLLLGHEHSVGESESTAVGVKETIERSQKSGNFDARISRHSQLVSARHVIDNRTRAENAFRKLHRRFEKASELRREWLQSLDKEQYMIGLGNFHLHFLKCKTLTILI